MVRTLGVEEELLLVDPETRRSTDRSRQVLKQFREHGRGGRTPVATDDLDQELFRHQLEVRTHPTTDLSEAAAQIVEGRRVAGEAAEASGVAAVACGIVPHGRHDAAVSPNDRYLAMVDVFGEVARHGGTCGLHVHVGIESDEEAVAVIDRIAPWLPSVLAISANSPFHDDRDTGYASWRSQLWNLWPSAGQLEAFGSLEGYHEAGRFLLASGAARDERMLYFDARLSTRQPTVEVRVADVCTNPDDAVLVAALVRGLVETASRAWRAGDVLARWRSEQLRASQWRAAKYGLSDALVDPRSRELGAAREVLDALVAEIYPALEEAGDVETVTDGIRRVVAHNGASAQRAAYERTGDIVGVVDDLIARSRACWSG